MSTSRPPRGTPEFDLWLLEMALRDAERLFRDPLSPELVEAESGIIAGPRQMGDLLPEKTIAEDLAIDRQQAGEQRAIAGRTAPALIATSNEAKAPSKEYLHCAVPGWPCNGIDVKREQDMRRPGQ